MRAKSQRILALNKKLAQDLELYRFKDLPVLGGGVGLESIKSIEPSKNRYDAVFVGRLSRTKGVYDLLDIWEKVCDSLPKARLAVIGGGPDNLTKELKDLAIRKSVAHNVAFLGFISDKEKFAAMKSSRLFLFPSHEEGWGLVVAEAMACGLPIAAYDLDIFGSVYKKGYLTVPLFDTESLAESVLKVLEKKDYAKSLSKDALAESSNFDNQIIVRNFLEFLDLANG